VHSYLDALKGGDYQTCYRMLAESDLVFGSLDGFLGQIPMAPIVERRWFAKVEAATRYRVGTAVESGSEAIVPIDVVTPNLVLWERMLGASNLSRQQVWTEAEKQLAGGSYPLLSYPDRIVMMRESGEWRVLAGYAQRARISRLHDQALAAYHQFQYDQSLALYHQMLEQLTMAPFSASGEIGFRLHAEMKKIEAARASVQAAQAYLPKLVLKNVQTNMEISGAPAIFGQIVNSGGRALDQVELTVSYYSPDGKLVYTEKHAPIALPLEFTDFDLPLVPFGSGQSRDLGMRLSAPFDIQQDNKVRMTVSGVIFSDALGAPPKLAARAAPTAGSQR